MKGEKKQGKSDEIVRLNRELSILNAISQTVNESIDLDEILNKSLNKIVELTEIQSVGIYLLEEKTNELIYVVHKGFSMAFSKGMQRLKLGEGATGKVALSGEPLFIDDYPGYSEAIPFAIEEGLKSLAVIPLRTREKIYGTLNIARRELSQFTPSTRNLLSSIGQIISSALERASLYSENVKRLEEQKTLYAISKEIASRLELKVILEKIVKSAIELLKVDGGSVALWDQRKQAYVNVIVDGLPKSFAEKEFTPSSIGVVGEVLRKKGPVLYKDYENNPNRIKELDSLHLKEVVGVPLIVRDLVIGVMTIGTLDPQKHFQQSEIELLFGFAQQAGIAIGNAQLYEDSLAKIRQLTTLYEVGKKLSSTLDLDELLKNALELLRTQWGYPLCSK
ncbi:MAG: GAF domain-containing protein, partial [Deltaproteobacteria bacterium]|nr:GAF domain-containing protein [Deltaproteobacteria bacterium]